MTWNYRVLKEKYIAKDGVVEYSYTIHETYYNKKGKIEGITENACAPFGETPEELKSVHKMMEDAFSKKVLIYDENDNVREEQI
jgi:hypothetical protein